MSDDREYMRVYMAQRYERRRAAAIAALGGCCARCASVEELDFDHIDPTTKSFTVGSRLAGISEARLQAELAKCQLLCRPCHLDKTREGGENTGAGRRKGSDNNFAKLSEQQVIEIREKYVPRRYTMPRLSVEYGVTVGTIKLIVARKTWAHVPQAEVAEAPAS